MTGLAAVFTAGWRQCTVLFVRVEARGNGTRDYYYPARLHWHVQKKCCEWHCTNSCTV